MIYIISNRGMTVNRANTLENFSKRRRAIGLGIISSVLLVGCSNAQNDSETISQPARTFETPARNACGETSADVPKRRTSDTYEKSVESDVRIPLYNLFEKLHDSKDSRISYESWIEPAGALAGEITTIEVIELKTPDETIVRLVASGNDIGDTFDSINSINQQGHEWALFGMDAAIIAANSAQEMSQHNDQPQNENYLSQVNTDTYVEGSMLDGIGNAPFRFWPNDPWVCGHDLEARAAETVAVAQATTATQEIIQATAFVD